MDLRGFILGALLALGFLSAPGALTILTEEDPPYNYTGSGGVPAGFTLELVQALQKDLGNQDRIQFVPWARAYDRALKEPGILVFTMARTLERENKFCWVGPLVENSWILYGRNDSSLKLQSLEDAKALTAIGVVRSFASEQFLKTQGFKNLDAVAENSQNLKRVQAGRIPVFASSDKTFPGEVQKAGYGPSDFKPLLTFHRVQLYLAFSRTTDREVMEAWLGAFERFKARGGLDQLHAKYFPGITPPLYSIKPLD